MNTINRRIGIMCALLLVGALPVLVGAAPQNMPPRPPITRPTSTPMTQPTATPIIQPAPAPAAQASSGASIQLYVHFPPQGLAFPWQELWTAMQWQDSQGQWHKVEGWQGNLDNIQDGIGQKVWWAAEKDLDAGPFRWIVYRREDGEALGKSEPFYLPHADPVQLAPKGTEKDGGVKSVSSPDESNIRYLHNPNCLVVEVELIP